MLEDESGGQNAIEAGDMVQGRSQIAVLARLEHDDDAAMVYGVDVSAGKVGNGGRYSFLIGGSRLHDR